MYVFSWHCAGTCMALLFFVLVCFVLFVLFCFCSRLISCLFLCRLQSPLNSNQEPRLYFHEHFKDRFYFFSFFFETRTTSLKIVAPFLVKGVNHIETLTRRFHAMLNLFSVKNDLKSNMIQSKWLSYTNNTFILWCICTICSVVVPYCCYIVILNNVKYIFDFFLEVPYLYYIFISCPTGT